MKPIRICITGGHATPALAVASYIQKNEPEWELLWIGRAVALEGTTVQAEEPRLVRDLGIPFYAIDAGRMSFGFHRASFLAWIKIPLGFWQAYTVLKHHRPSLILSFGGYIAVPVAMSAWLLGIPVVTHEQTHSPGVANRLIASIAKRICVSYLDTKHQFPKEKTVLTGLPIRSEIFAVPKKPSFPIPEGDKPLLYIMGGSTGSTSINAVVYEALPQLLDSYRIIHQTGALSYQDACVVKKNLSLHQNRYTVVPYLAVSDLAWVYHRAALVIGRSGANTVGELKALGKRAICIPLPWARDHEQEKNAQDLVRTHQASIVPQETLTPASLLDAIHMMLTQKNAPQRQTDEVSDAKAVIVQQIRSLV